MIIGNCSTGLLKMELNPTYESPKTVFNEDVCTHVPTSESFLGNKLRIYLYDISYTFEMSATACNK